MSVDILFSASEYSQPTGKIIFLASCVIVCFNYFFSGYIPQILITPSYSILTVSLIGVIYFNLKYRNTPHVAIRECPQCGSKMKYSGLKCLDEFHKGCQFSSKFK
jgi:hypothetical protein